MNLYKFLQRVFEAALITLLLVGCSAPMAPKLAPREHVTSPVILKEVPLARAIGVKTSGDSLWAWSENEIWRYTRGEWAQYATGPGDSLFDVAYVNEILWAVDEGELGYLEGEDWQKLSERHLEALWIEADEQNGILWVSDFYNLYRWNGEEMSDVGQPPNTNRFIDEIVGIVGEIAVMGDGTVWVGGMYMYFPETGGLARYDDTTGSWEMVRPWRADEDVPAVILATTPNGGLWAVLADYSKDWEKLQEAEEPYKEWALAHRDGATGEWSVFEGELPEGVRPAIAADDEAVWLAQGRWPFEPFDGLARFDGETWSHYLPGEVIEDIAIAPDESIWYIAAD